MMKLFLVSVMDDTEMYEEVVVARTDEEAEERVANMGCWDCFMFASAKEISVVDGYKIKLEKVDKHESK